MSQPLIKVCGLTDPHNIKDVLTLGPQYIGLIFYPKSARYIGELDPEYLLTLKNVKKTGVFVNSSITEVEQMMVKYQLDAIQLHGNESPEFCSELMASMQMTEAGVEIIKAFGVDIDFDFQQLEAYLSVVDYFLFDTKTPLHGGSGKAFDWHILDRYSYDKPFFLSGGIGPDNFKHAYQIEDERLYALDLNSRFESSPGFKNISLLQQVLEK